MKQILFYLVVFSVINIFSSCGGKSETEDGSKDTLSKDTNSASSEFKVDFSKVNTIPVPIELATTIKQSKANYDKSLLNPVENAKKYNQEHQMAFNLGIYSVDLGFANLYEKNQDAINYLDAVKEISDGLKISQFYNFDEIRQLAKDGKDVEELLQKSLIGFDNMRNALKEENREEAVFLMIAGGWLEALYLGTHVAKTTDDKGVKESIVNQKKILNELLLPILENNQNASKHIAEIYNDFKKIQEAYQPISMEQKEEGTAPELSFTKESLEALNNTVTEVRKHWIG